MDYDKIIIDMLNRIGSLEDKVSKLEIGLTKDSPEEDVPIGSKKYRYLSDYLHNQNEACIKLSFKEIEEILKFELPKSAQTHRAFWANTTSHSIALSWLSVNYQVVEVNLEYQYVVFEKKRNYTKVTIDDQMRIIVSELISRLGINHIISVSELYSILIGRFDTNKDSIIPSDYCYNRVNKGLEFQKKPHLFEFLGNGEYKCLGENYPYTGDVIDANNESIVGSWTNGVFHKNANWEKCGLKVSTQ